MEVTLEGQQPLPLSGVVVYGRSEAVYATANRRQRGAAVMPARRSACVTLGLSEHGLAHRIDRDPLPAMTKV